MRGHKNHILSCYGWTFERAPVFLDNLVEITLMALVKSARVIGRIQLITGTLEGPRKEAALRQIPTCTLLFCGHNTFF